MSFVEECALQAFRALEASEALQVEALNYMEQLSHKFDEAQSDLRILNPFTIRSAIADNLVERGAGRRDAVLIACVVELFWKLPRNRQREAMEYFKNL